MTTKNLIKKENKFAKEYIAEVVSNEDPLMRGRLQVKVESILGDIPFWVNATLVAGSVRFTLIPEPMDLVTVKFKNKDIYSGEWELKGSPNNEAQIDPKKYGLSDAQGNFILIDRTTNDINVNSMNNYNLNVAGVANITIVGDAIIKCANADLTAENVDVHAKAVNLGDGGKPIARVGDQVEVNVTSGSSAGKHMGTITSGGTNTSI